MSNMHEENTLLTTVQAPVPAAALTDEASSAVANECDNGNITTTTTTTTATATTPTAGKSVQNDVIISKDLTTDANIVPPIAAAATATTTTTVQQDEYPTTPKGIFMKLSTKRPANLTLNILPTKTTTTTKESNYAETDNITLSNQNKADTGNTAASTTFPHEQNKTMKKLDLSFKNVRFSKKVGFFRPETKDILCGLSGHFCSGELSAIIGPSGAGKSTLLNILSGYISYGYTGEFAVNGSARDLKAFKPNVAFIMQDTSLQPFLTVKEAMHFATNLKVGAHLSQTAKRERVRKILEAIGMYENRHTRTGKLSGGQRKRLAIALELVNNPPVLVLDEPTTGLDSSTTIQLITLLKKLALEGRTVLCTIHQPSALTFQMFDHIYAIAEGQCIYAGGANNLVPFLDEIDMPCPESYNPADYLMEIATHDYGKQNPKLVALIENGENNDYRQGKTEREAQLAALRKADNILSTSMLTPVTAPVLATPTPNVRLSQSVHATPKPLTTINEMSSKEWSSQAAGGEPSGGNSSSSSSSGSGSGSGAKTKQQPQPQQQQSMKPKSAIQLDPSNLCQRDNIYPTPFYRQLSLLLLRTFLILWRDSSLTTLRFVIHLVTGLLIGCLFYGIGDDAKNALNNWRYAFYTIMFIMYCAFSGILVKFPLEFPIVSREHFNRWYSLRAYYVALTLADIPLQIICTSLFIFPSYYMTGQPMEFQRIALFFFINFLTALVAQSIGLAVGAALSIQLGAILGPFFICPFLQFSGFFVLERDAPVYLRWMFKISFLKYSLDGAALALFGYDRERLTCNEIFCYHTRPKFLLKSLDMTGADYQVAVIFLFGIFIFLRILAFYIMSFRLRLFR